MKSMMEKMEVEKMTATATAAAAARSCD